MQYQVSDFDYDLPQTLIATQPTPCRTSSRLLRCESGECTDHSFSDLPDFLLPGDLLVCNNTRVIPARLFGQKETGGAVECLVERIIDEDSAWVHLRSSKSPKVGTMVRFAEGKLEATVVERDDALFHLRFHTLPEESLLASLTQYGEIPLPPYMQRKPVESDAERYQTVFASSPGAVAAPTAGLHFDDALLDKLRKQGVESAQLTLHVGAGTFQPVREDDLSKHVMHSERVVVPAEVCKQIAQTKARGGRVVAVGTTVVRSLETAAAGGQLGPFEGDSRLFITPGFDFKVVDLLITNFHLPKSTLLMLISAFGGHDAMLSAYQHAIRSEYRFFSYGDAMLISPER